MRLRYKVAVVVGGLLVFYKACVYTPEPTGPDVLPPNAVAVVTLGPSHSTLIDNTTTGPIVIPNYGHGSTVVVGTDGSVKVKPKTKGFSFDPGLSTDFHHVAVALELAYWRRLSLLTGINIIDFNSGYPTLGAYAGIGYRMPWRKVNNLSAYVGFDTDSRIRTGIFWRFGNS